MSKLKARAITIPALFTAIIVILSQIVIPIEPIPFSFSLLAIFLTGALLEPKQAFFATLAYVMLGVVGLPVFAGQKGGLGIVLSVTGGFIIAYPVMAFITSTTIKLSKNRSIFFTVLGMLIALSICYLFGSIWFVIVAKSTLQNAFRLCVFPFIPFDLLKIAAATGFSMAVKKAIPQLS